VSVEMGECLRVRRKSQTRHGKRGRESV